jgi:ketosteroid isomerase-like protein
MNRSDVQDWLNRYVAAWHRREPDQIAQLFSDSAVYRYNPYGDESQWVRGREAIVQAWLEEDDEPGSWEASYQPIAVDGDRAVATGISRYLASGDVPESTYHNAFLLRFDADGACSEFVDYFLLAKPPTPA